MKSTLLKTFSSLYTVAMSLFLLMAFALVMIQIVGLVAVQPGWIEGASTTLLRPAIVTAVVAGLFGFAVYNVKDAGKVDDVEE